MAFSLTGDAGCESGGGVNCTPIRRTLREIISFKQSFLGYMLYNRWWFHHDRYGLTVGGGRSITLDAIWCCCRRSTGNGCFGTPYFTENPETRTKPGCFCDLRLHAEPVHYLPLEFNHRHANVPYFSGPGGVTPRAKQWNPGATMQAGSRTSAH